MNRIKAQLSLHYISYKRSFKIFWIICMAIFIILSITNFFNSNGSRVGYAGGNLIAIFVFLLVSALSNLHDTFPYALSMNSTRKEYLKGKIIFYTLLSVVMAFMQLGLLLLERLLFSIAGWEFQRILQPTVDISNAFTMVGFLFFMIGTFISILGAFSLLAAFFYRFGKLFGFTFLGISVMILFSNVFINLLGGLMYKMFKLFFGRGDSLLAGLVFIGIGLLCFILEWVVVSKMAVLKKR